MAAVFLRTRLLTHELLIDGHELFYKRAREHEVIYFLGCPGEDDVHGDLVVVRRVRSVRAAFALRRLARSYTWDYSYSLPGLLANDALNKPGGILAIALYGVCWFDEPPYVVDDVVCGITCKEGREGILRLSSADLQGIGDHEGGHLLLERDDLAYRDDELQERSARAYSRMTGDARQ